MCTLHTYTFKGRVPPIPAPSSAFPRPLQSIKGSVQPRVSCVACRCHRRLANNIYHYVRIAVQYLRSGCLSDSALPSAKVRLETLRDT